MALASLYEEIREKQMSQPQKYAEPGKDREFTIEVPIRNSRGTRNRNAWCKTEGPTMDGLLVALYDLGGVANTRSCLD